VYPGHAVEGGRWLRETIALIPIVGVPAIAQLWTLDALAESAALTGEPERATGYADRLRAVLPGGFVAPRRSGTVWSLAATGARTDAAGRARAAARELRTAGSLLMAAWVLHDAARLGAARQVRDELAALVRRCQSPLVETLAANATALAAGDPDALDAAAATLAATGCELWAAESYSESARLHRVAGRAGAALAATSRAEALAAGCRSVATPLLAGPPAADPLTRREREVAELAAAGYADRDIAERLHLSSRTVHSHLYRAYRKLGVANRTALGELLGPRPYSVGKSAGR
jgi:DNA-binding NarL/FixJ family response regulator